MTGEYGANQQTKVLITRTIIAGMIHEYVNIDVNDDSLGGDLLKNNCLAVKC